MGEENFLIRMHNEGHAELAARAEGSISAVVPGYGAWVDVDDTCPTIGQTVILFANGVVQKETYTLDMDDNEYGARFFWHRDELAECPYVESGQKWMPLPTAP